MKQLETNTTKNFAQIFLYHRYFLIGIPVGQHHKIALIFLLFLFEKFCNARFAFAGALNSTGVSGSSGKSVIRLM